VTTELFNNSHIQINSGQVSLVANPNLDIKPFSQVRVVILLPNIQGLHLQFDVMIVQGGGILYTLDSISLGPGGHFNRLYQVPGLSLNIRVQSLPGSPPGSFGVLVYAA
jgi:hypothetical protein